MSVPSVLLGINPGASVERFHAAPALWQHAEAAGYSTFLLSAQSWHYADLDRFLLTTPPQVVWTAEPETGVELSNGGGMDDEEFMPRVLEQLAVAVRAGRPFFGVVQFNATHHPFLLKPAASPEFDVSERVGRYDNAIRFLDGAIVSLFDELERRGVLDNTVVLLTADHGENHDVRPIHRTQSFHEEVAAIPLVVYLPDSQRQRRPAALEQLRAATGAVVQNLDVAPTLLDFMLGDSQVARRAAPEFDGQSLLTPLPPLRTLVARNVVPIRRWSNEGFSLNRGPYRYIFTEWWGEELYDLGSDPLEQSNLLPLAPLPAWVSQSIGAAPELADVYYRFCQLRERCARTAQPATGLR